MKIKPVIPIAKEPSRASLRRKLLKALKTAKKSRTKQGTSIIISRTVEMVNQKTEAWRNAQSQLLFITGLGLTPKPSWRGLIPFSLKISDCFSSSDDRKKSGSNRIDTIYPNHSLPASSASNKSVYTQDDDCICVRIIKYKTVKGYPNLKVAVTTNVMADNECS